MKSRIYIAGGMYGCHNVGDEAVLLSTINSFSKQYLVSVSSQNESWLKTEYPNVSVNNSGVLFGRPKMGLSAVPRKKIISNFNKIRKEKHVIASTDGFICGGGTIFSDCPWHAMRLVRIANNYKKPVIVWGSGMADGNDNETNQFIVDTMNMKNVQHIYLRDEFVKQRLLEIGVHEEKLNVCYDPAFMLEGENFDLSLYLSPKQIEMLHNGKKNFAVTISGEVDAVERTPIKIILEAICKLKSIFDSNFFLIPSGCGEHCKDLQMLLEIKSMADFESVEVVDRELAPQHMIQLLKGFDMIISSRLHMNIFAACGGGQSIGLVRNSKIIDFANIMHQPYLELQNLNSEDIVEAVKDSLRSADENKMYISQVVDRMRIQHSAMLKDALTRFGI